MKKRLKKIIVGMMMLMMPIAFTSCASFTPSKTDDLLAISGIETKTDENGNIIVTIKYNDENKTPLVFTVPKGKDGTNGVSIENITYQQSEDGKFTIVTIYYTDPSIEPTTIKINNGLGVKSIETKENDDGSVTLIFTYSDGSKSDPLIVPKGDPGIGITSIDSTLQEDGSTKLTINFSDGSYTEVTIPAGKKGDDGRGIKSIAATTNDDYYILTITYTDGSPNDTLTFDKPKDGVDGATWLSGDGAPSDSLGRVGDYYFDNKNTAIYLKKENGWVKVVSFFADQTQYTVTFIPGDDAYMPAGWEAPYIVKGITRGSYITSVRPLPIPTKKDYTFKGWCTSEYYNPTTGLFTDLTPVMGNLTLYALWG